ncbi:E3 ubiquitin-protein ligase PDZRN3-like [Mya arenaria]|uniref:E3 ubiquitin-protein ligase PDZRN3-like n=1 Tax=Mya arenaria TaxID=6604 RepID=UPI0022E527DB|nr:E3 ubiquitin-protein ligase PDZRN3-like [Mya arenaria]
MGLGKELFEGPLEDDFLCGLCGQVLLNPVTAGCQHVFCQQCVIRKMKSRVTKPVCPVCSLNLSLDMKDTTVEFKLKLLNLNVRCNHKCGESFVLAELPDHIEACPNAPVECDFKGRGCKRTIKRCDKRKHSDECDFREVECEACGHRTIYRELCTHQSRVRCLENKLKQQIIREKKATSREIIRHRERLIKDNAKLDQQQRKKILSHAIALSSRKHGRQSVNFDESFSEEYAETGADGVFLTENTNDEYSRRHVQTDDNQNMTDLKRMATKTPHSSRSGFATQMCAQCNRKFKPDQNTCTSCRWHVGPMVSNIFILGT